MRGSLTPLGPNHWRLRVYVGRTEKGHALCRSRNFKGGKRAAENALREFIEECAPSDRGSAMTVADLVGRWLAVRSSTLAPSTVTGYERYIRNYILPTFGRTRIDKLKPEALDRAYATWLKHLSPSSVHQIHSILCAAFTQAVKWGWIGDSPVARATGPSVSHKATGAISFDEARDILSLAEQIDGPGGVLPTAIALGALTGARRGELCALRWTDIDLEAGTMTIGRALTTTPERGARDEH